MQKCRAWQPEAFLWMRQRSIFLARSCANGCVPIIPSVILFLTPWNSILLKTLCIGIVIMFKSHPEKITQPTRRLVFAGVLFIVGLLATQMFWTGPRSVVSAQDQRTPVPLVTL